MHIGLVYDLRDDYRKLGYGGEDIAEFDSESTIEALEEAIASHGHTVERVGNIWRLTEMLAAGKRWDMVFNIAEGLHGTAREAQVPALLDAYNLPYTFSAPEVMILCQDKALAKTIVKAAGVPVADSVIIRDAAECAHVALPWPLFAKPLAEGTGKGVSDRSKITSPAQLEEVCADLLRRFRQPVLVETFLPGREFTVGILGTGAASRSIGTLEVVLKAGAERVGHTYHNKEHCETLIDYVFVCDAVARKSEEIALAAWRILGCRDGGRIDLRCDASGHPVFLEANPLAGLHPTHSDLPILAEQVGIPYRALIGEILASAQHSLRLSRLPIHRATA